MELFNHLALGFGVALSPANLFYCFAGALLGTLVGVLPGLGPVATISMLLPATFSLSPESALIMLAGIYYGAQYGGSTTAILLNLPGESSSVVTAIDGYQMARNGRAGAALAIAAIASFFAGCVATVLIAVAAPLLAAAALRFGPADYFSLLLLGLVASVVLANGSVLKAVAMIALGILFGIVGTDVSTSVRRFTFGVPELVEGLDFVALSMGVYGIAEIISTLRHTPLPEGGTAKIDGLMPTRAEFRASVWPILRGTALGSVLGVLPGGGALLASFSAYSLEKKLARDPSRFGKGAIEGVAGPESANNAGAQTSFVPLLTLGIPSNALMAMVVGALLVQGVTPGPQLIVERPTLFWGVIASMWIGNAMLVILNLPLVGVWVKVLSAPYRFLFPCIVLICCVGAYSINSSPFGVVLVAVFGALGYLFYLLRCEPAPFLMGLILGPMLEENLRRAMQMAGGDPREIVEHPISMAFLGVTVLLLGLILAPSLQRARETAFQET